MWKLEKMPTPQEFLWAQKNLNKIYFMVYLKMIGDFKKEEKEKEKK